jgi:hypothetical protein
VGQKVLSKPSADSFAVGRRQKGAADALASMDQTTIASLAREKASTEVRTSAHTRSATRDQIMPYECVVPLTTGARTVCFADIKQGIGVSQSTSRQKFQSLRRWQNTVMLQILGPRSRQQLLSGNRVMLTAAYVHAWQICTFALSFPQGSKNLGGPGQRIAQKVVGSKTPHHTVCCREGLSKLKKYQGL